uniref:Uncharacterized protein n=1 Tax=Anopheles culicifacies TaxID=139723 RepID=A0A182MLX3_9DIPT
MVKNGTCTTAAIWQDDDIVNLGLPVCTYFFIGTHRIANTKFANNGPENGYAAAAGAVGASMWYIQLMMVYGTYVCRKSCVHKEPIFMEPMVGSQRAMSLDGKEEDTKPLPEAYLSRWLGPLVMEWNVSAGEANSVISESSRKVHDSHGDA